MFRALVVRAQSVLLEHYGVGFCLANAHSIPHVVPCVQGSAMHVGVTCAGRTRT